MDARMNVVANVVVDIAILRPYLVDRALDADRSRDVDGVAH
jgi:hypothetical protein